MTDYKSIKPEDVREGDKVRGCQQRAGRSWTAEGAIWRTASNELALGESMLYSYVDLRLVSRPTPPEPPVWVGDWVRDMSGIEFQLTDPRLLGASPGWRASLTRIEPPVGWPVGVPTEDGTRWYVRDSPFGNYKPTTPERDNREWTSLLAAGGVPALAVTR